MRSCVLDPHGCPYRVDGCYGCYAPTGKALECALQRIREDNAACICGCPLSEHENLGEDGEQCEHEDHECLRVSAAALQIVTRYHKRIAELEKANAEFDKRNWQLEQDKAAAKAENQRLRTELEVCKSALVHLMDTLRKADSPACNSPAYGMSVVALKGLVESPSANGPESTSADKA